MACSQLLYYLKAYLVLFTDTMQNFSPQSSQNIQAHI
jgi:hypothetical protein